jgi:hypothetical protein
MLLVSSEVPLQYWLFTPDSSSNPGVNGESYRGVHGIEGVQHSMQQQSQEQPPAGVGAEAVGAPVLMSGGRICYENITGLFLWLNPTGR